MRKTLQLQELKPNPFKKEIQGGRIDPLVVKQIAESASKTSFWEQWVARETVDGVYQIAFGHHRLAAAIQLFGKKHQVSVQLEDYTDEQMLIALADENAGNEATVRERIDTVLLAQRYLTENPKLSSRTTPSKTGEQRDPASVRQIAEFLGEENWSKDTVSDALLLSKLDPKVLDKIAPIGTTHPSRKQMLSVKAALALTEIENKKTQVAVAQEILSEPSEMGFQEIRDIVDEAKQEPTPERAQSTARQATQKARKVADERKKVSNSNERPFADYRAPGPKPKLEEKKLSTSILSKYARQIVDAGRREIARKIHPDKQTGDNEEMIRLNAAAEWLKNLIEEAE